MAWKGIKHISVGEEMTQAEYEAETGHEIAKGISLPETANDGDFFLKTDEHRLYIYIQE